MKLFGAEDATAFPEGTLEELERKANQLQKFAIINSIIVGTLVVVLVIGNIAGADTRNTTAMAILLGLNSVHLYYNASKHRTAYWLKLRE